MQESAKDAFWIVNKLFSEGDFETLAPMVSQNLLAAFRCVASDISFLTTVSVLLLVEDLRAVGESSRSC